MDLKEKLRFIEQIQKPRPHEERTLPAQPGIEEIIDGELRRTELGTTFIRTCEYDIHMRHGAVAISQIDEVTPQFLQLAGKDDNLLQLDWRRTCFFDTETTGLAGGSGTLIFLMGMGYFEQDKFIIKQFFLRDFPDELATLQLIHDTLAQFEGLVSFNGKSFDWPLLQTRFIHHRIQNRLLYPPHLDLLHAARRIWKNRLKDCSLNNLESEILEVRREHDLPSYLIPQLYFEYLRVKNPLPLKIIFRHNEWDILSLVSLTIRLHQIHKQPLEELTYATDLRTLARHYERTQQWQRNIPLYRSLLENNTTIEEKTEISLRLSFCYKRLQQWSEAVTLWQNIIAHGSFRIEPYEELAKYYEHQIFDYARAEHIVLKALEQLDLMEQIRGQSHYSSYCENLRHRLQRIQHKKSHNFMPPAITDRA